MILAGGPPAPTGPRGCDESNRAGKEGHGEPASARLARPGSGRLCQRQLLASARHGSELGRAEVRSSFITTTVRERIPGHTKRAPPVVFELEINGFQFYAIANLDKTSLILIITI